MQVAELLFTQTQHMIHVAANFMKVTERIKVDEGGCEIETFIVV